MSKKTFGLQHADGLDTPEKGPRFESIEWAGESSLVS